MRRVFLFPGLLVAALAGAVAWPGLHAPAQSSAPVGPGPQSKPEMTESCPGLVALGPLAPIPAAFRRAALDADQVRITYVGHSTFLIQSPKLRRAPPAHN